MASAFFCLEISCLTLCQLAFNIDKLDELYCLGGTSGDAGPKILTVIDQEEWIIKFPANVDGKDAGQMEFDYSCCAGKCDKI